MYFSYLALVAGLISVASPTCYQSNLSAINPPSYFAPTTPANTSVADGSYLYLNCTMGPNNTYMTYNETAPPMDNAVDGQLGVMCENGSFVPPSPSWPASNACVVVATCNVLPTPPPQCMFQSIAATMAFSGASVTYSCANPNATLNDGSGNNFLTLYCVNATLGTMASGSTFVQGVPSPFPTCRSPCTNFYVGNKQFTVVNSSAVVWSGDSAIFSCPSGFYVSPTGNETSNYNQTTAAELCQSDGTFQTESRLCLLIPCAAGMAIEAVTPPEGDFVTTANENQDYYPGDVIFFKCNDSMKVPANGKPNLVSVCQRGGNFSQLVLPSQPYPNRCVYTCSSYLNITGMQPVSTVPVLANSSVEYTCRNKSKIPNTGSQLFIPCQFDGTFQTSASYPQCVVGCVKFPIMTGFSPSSLTPLLVGGNVTYNCSTPGYVPHTDVDLLMVCLSNGTLVPDPNAITPVCVPQATCRIATFPTNPNYQVNDTNIQYYYPGQSIEMSCTGDMVAEDPAHVWATTTFGIKCVSGNNGTTAAFQSTPAASWPRCLPSVCSNSQAFQQLVSIQDTCVCKFTQCTEYIFSSLIYECPAAPSGPFCGLIATEDDYNETMSLFAGSPPSEIPTDDELAEMGMMSTDLNSTSSAVAGMTTNSSTSGRRKKRQSGVDVPETCAGVNNLVILINGLLDYGKNSKVYQISTIRRYCSYILQSAVSYTDCSNEGQVTALAASNVALGTKIGEFLVVWAQLVLLNQAYTKNATAINQAAIAAAANASVNEMAYAQAVNFLPYNASGVQIPSSIPTAAEIANLTKASNAISQTNTAVNGLVNGTATGRKKRSATASGGVPTTCQGVMNQTSLLLQVMTNGSVSKVYNSTAIIEHCQNILQSPVTHQDCVAEGLISKLATSVANFSGTCSAVQGDVRALTLLSQGVLDNVVAQVANVRSAFVQMQAQNLHQTIPPPTIYNPLSYPVGASDILSSNGQQLPPTVPTPAELMALTNATKTVANVTSAIASFLLGATGNTGTAQGQAGTKKPITRRKRSAPTTCAELIAELQNIEKHFDFGNESKVYLADQINCSAQNILANSEIALNDCKKQGLLDTLSTINDNIVSQTAQANEDAALLGKVAQHLSDPSVMSILATRNNTICKIAQQLQNENIPASNALAGNTNVKSAINQEAVGQQIKPAGNAGPDNLSASKPSSAGQGSSSSGQQGGMGQEGTSGQGGMGQQSASGSKPGNAGQESSSSDQQNASGAKPENAGQGSSSSGQQSGIVQEGTSALQEGMGQERTSGQGGIGQQNASGSKPGNAGQGSSSSGQQNASGAKPENAGQGSSSSGQQSGIVQEGTSALQEGMGQQNAPGAKPGSAGQGSSPSGQQGGMGQEGSSALQGGMGQEGTSGQGGIGQQNASGSKPGNAGQGSSSSGQQNASGAKSENAGQGSSSSGQQSGIVEEGTSALQEGMGQQNAPGAKPGSAGQGSSPSGQQGGMGQEGSSALQGGMGQEGTSGQGGIGQQNASGSKPGNAGQGSSASGQQNASGAKPENAGQGSSSSGQQSGIVQEGTSALQLGMGQQNAPGAKPGSAGQSSSPSGQQGGMGQEGSSALQGGMGQEGTSGQEGIGQQNASGGKPGSAGQGSSSSGQQNASGAKPGNAGQGSSSSGQQSGIVQEGTSALQGGMGQQNAPGAKPGSAGQSSSPSGQQGGMGQEGSSALQGGMGQEGTSGQEGIGQQNASGGKPGSAGQGSSSSGQQNASGAKPGNAGQGSSSSGQQSGMGQEGTSALQGGMGQQNAPGAKPGSVGQGSSPSGWQGGMGQEGSSALQGGMGQEGTSGQGGMGQQNASGAKPGNAGQEGSSSGQQSGMVQKGTSALQGGMGQQNASGSKPGSAGQGSSPSGQQGVMGQGGTSELQGGTGPKGISGGKPGSTDHPSLTSSLESIRRKRWVALHFLSRKQKRSITFSCNTTMVYGIDVSNIYNQSSIQANRCCCPDYQGELFNLFVTINTPWSNILADQRSSFYASMQLMVSQEMRYLLNNTNYSSIAMAGIIGNLSFVSFQATSGSQIGVNYQVLLTRPHWDNDVNIEQSFIAAANAYFNSTDPTVLGHMVQGKFSKNDYITDPGTRAPVATQIPFPSDQDSGSGDGEGSGESSATSGDAQSSTALTVALVIIAIIVLVAIPVAVVYKSQACLLKQCFAK